MATVLHALRNPRGDYARLLGRPRYRGFVLTVVLARVSGAMFNVAGVLLVLERTQSPSITGLTAAATTAVGGVIADPVGLIYLFGALNLAAAAVALLGIRGAQRQAATA